MDDIDRKIVSLLEKNSRISLNQLSQHVFLTPPAVAARIEKLETRGILKGYHAIVDMEKLGFPIVAFVELTMPPEEKTAFTSFITDCPNVTECHHVAGAYSMLIKVCFATPSKLDAFVGSLQHFGKTQTQIVFSTVVESRGIF